MRSGDVFGTRGKKVWYIVRIRQALVMLFLLGMYHTLALAQQSGAQEVWYQKGIGNRVTAFYGGMWYIPGINFRVFRIDFNNPGQPQTVLSARMPNQNGHNWCIANGRYFQRWYSMPESNGSRFVDFAGLSQGRIVPSNGNSEIPDGVDCFGAATYPYDIDFNRLYQAQGGNSMGDPIVIGNLVVFTYESSNTSTASGRSSQPIVTYDISNPSSPRHLSTIITGAQNYTSSGKFYASSNLGDRNLVLLMGNEGDSVIETVDFTDPTNLRRGPTIQGYRGRYIQLQDNFGFGSSFGTGVKVDFTQGRVVQTWQTRNGMDFYWMPAGNLLLGSGSQGGESSDESAIIVLSSQRDTNPPRVGFHNPANRAVGLPVTARVGVVIHETLDPATVTSANIILRPFQGNPVGTLISYKDNDVINIAPRERLAANTTYEVVLRAGGIKDAAGNGIQGFSFCFSTGASIAQGAACGGTSSTTNSQSVPALGSGVTPDVFACGQNVAQFKTRTQTIATLLNQRRLANDSSWIVVANSLNEILSKYSAPVTIQGVGRVNLRLRDRFMQNRTTGEVSCACVNQASLKSFRRLNSRLRKIVTRKLRKQIAKGDRIFQLASPDDVIVE